ncbi:BTB/POZ domain-containing protein [Phthorimaea operculella]|nr:BTB/POZ domain-containing protein [Phthorimaea operculella]
MMSGDKLIKVTDIDQQGACLDAKLEVTTTNLKTNELTIFYSPEYILNSVLLQMRIDVMKKFNNRTNQYEYSYTLFVKTGKAYKTDAMKIILKFSSKELGIENKTFSSKYGGWQMIQEFKSWNCSYYLDVSMEVDTEDTTGIFNSLYDDTSLTDFELCGDGGSVSVHKAVLAASSDVLKTMLCGDWKENKTGHVSIPGISKQTLEHFKSYLYLRKMPDNGFQELLLLASYYMMPGLEQKCIEMIAKRLNAQNLLSQCEFAVTNQMTKLHLAILEAVQSGQVKVKDVRATTIRKHQ